MKALFTGYFTPTDAEFKELWKTCVFGFDTNVLLGLYRSTSETQQVFFSVLKKVADRIFLPHQAANEYLRGRLSVISIRSDSFGKISSDAAKLATSIESTVNEHALRNGKELIKVAREAADKIRDLTQDAAKKEPDLLQCDDILEKLAELFGNRTGEQYSSTRLTELYSEAALRYAKGIPLGFKDEKKPEPDRYGDAIIWFQLLDYAKSVEKPLIFVTGDDKEDWWQKHKGQTIGPRPELRQEMMTVARVPFYLYTAPRFLEFAKQFLNLGFDTKKAESELEKIERQDKEASELTNVWPMEFNFQTYDVPKNHQPATVYYGDPLKHSSWWTTSTGTPAMQWMEPEDPKELRTNFLLFCPFMGIYTKRPRERGGAKS